MSATREAVRRALEEARAAYRDLISRVPDACWHLRSGIPEWTVAELAVHVTMYVPAATVGVKAARSGKPAGGITGRLLRPGLPDWLNRLLTRLAARGKSQADALAAYDRCHRRLLEILDTIKDDEWQKTAEILGRRMSIEGMLRNHADHVHEHIPQIAAVLPGKAAGA